MFVSERTMASARLTSTAAVRRSSLPPGLTTDVLYTISDCVVSRFHAMHRTAYTSIVADVRVSSHHMEETEAGFQRPLYVRNTARIRRILRKILVTTLQQCGS